MHAGAPLGVAKMRQYLKPVRARKVEIQKQKLWTTDCVLFESCKELQDVFAVAENVEVYVEPRSNDCLPDEKHISDIILSQEHRTTAWIRGAVMLEL
jgi:hypothetical protein